MCPFCGAARVAGGPLYPDRFAPRGRSLDLVRCTGCGTLETVLPPAVETTALPEEEVGGGGYLPHEIPAGARGWLAARGQDRKASIASPWYVGGTVVDVGCGSGGFLEAWRRGRPHDPILGIEPSSAADLARRRGMEVYEQPLESPLPEGARSAGLFTLWHVLEHLEDPLGAIVRLREALGPDGRIVLAVPNASALERAVFGQRTIAWDPPRHRWHFTPEGLTAITGTTGLRVLDRFNLVTDDVYDAVGSIRWTVYPGAWADPGSRRERLATGLAVAGGVPLGLGLATLTPWRSRASLGLVLAST